LNDQRLENIINRLDVLNKLIDTEEIKANAKNFTQKIKELEEALKKVSQNKALKSLIKKILENSNDMSLFDLIIEIRKNDKNLEQDILDLLKIKFLEYSFSEIN